MSIENDDDDYVAILDRTSNNNIVLDLKHSSKLRHGHQVQDDPCHSVFQMLQIQIV